MLRNTRSSRAALTALLAALLVAGIVPATGCTQAPPAATPVASTAPRPSIDTSAPANLEIATFGMG